MNKQNWALYLFIIFFSTNFFACKNDFEDYSNNPNDLLVFSIDTLSFDIVLSTVNSPVRFFRVYNRNAKPLLISSVKLAEGANSNFKINVDGMAGSVFENVEILANDSMYVFVDVKPKENGENTPILFNDYVIFETNGVKQRVVLEAIGQDVNIWRGVVLSSDSVLNNQKPYLIYDSLVIGNGSTVEIGENTVFYMFNDAQLIVNGTVKMKGTIEKPIVFRGSRTDKMLYIPYDLLPGQWGGIRISSESFGNELENVRIRNGKYGMFLDVSDDPSRNKLYMKNVVLTSVTGTLFQAVNCNIVAENCEFSNAKDFLLNIAGGLSRFIHCTIVNYYPSHSIVGLGDSKYKILHLSDSISNFEGKGSYYYPVLKADFYNSIIFGQNYSPDSVLIINKKHPDSENPFLENCLIPEMKSNNITTVNCVFQTKNSDLFIKSNPVDIVNNIWYPSFDFRLHKDSPAKNAANSEISSQIPFDMNGIYRLADDSPDIGTYEYYEDDN